MADHRCPRCGDSLTDYTEDDLVYLTGDERPYCSGECVVATWRAAQKEPTVGPRCGNNPNFRLSPGDRKAVDEFRAYLKRRRAGGPPERYPFSDEAPS
ncbi:hypothetical protein [Streptomyces aureus]